MSKSTKRDLEAALVHAAELIAHYAWPPCTKSRSQVRWLLMLAGATDHALHEHGTIHATTHPTGRPEEEKTWTSEKS